MVRVTKTAYEPLVAVCIGPSRKSSHTIDGRSRSITTYHIAETFIRLAVDILIVMSATTFDTTDTDRIAIDVLDGLTAAESKLVYVFLAASDGATIDELTDALEISKISLFPVLRTLIERNVVARDGSAYVPHAA